MMRVFIVTPRALRLLFPTSQSFSSGGRRVTCLSGGRFSGGSRSDRGSGAEEHQHCEHAPRLASARREAELPEDAGDVLLDCAEGDDEGIGDSLVGTAERHELDHLTLAR